MVRRRGAGTPIWIWLIYGAGVLAAVILVGSGLFALGAYLASDEDISVNFDVSTPGLVLWGGLVLLAAATWLVRRR